MASDKKPALLIMAAGMGSRYGGIKQIDGFGPNGETIMDYSLYDAIRAGFGKIVFVVRDEIKSAVEEMFLPKLKGKVEVCFATQTLEKFVPVKHGKVERKKPWGTTHAMLCGKEFINEPFAVINADDFYGKDSFESLATFFATAKPTHHAMVGYTLKDVLSEHGSVSRGVAEERDANGYLKTLNELKDIVVENGKIISREPTGSRQLSGELPVSMNCWGFMPSIYDFAEKLFHQFVDKNIDNPSAEFYIALLVNDIIKKDLGKIHIIRGGTTWFGVTYKEDKEEVSQKIKDLVKQGIYPNKLW